MRIAYVTETYPPEVNGMATLAAHMVEGLHACGHEVDLIRPRQPHEAELKTSQTWLTSARALPFFPGVRIGKASASAMRHRFIQHRPAVVHLSTPGPLSWAAMRAARGLAIPITTDFQANFHAYAGQGARAWLQLAVLRALRHFHNTAQRTHVPTIDLRQQLDLAGFERLQVIGRGVDTRRFSPQARSQALRERILGPHAPPDAPVLLYVGRLSREKNIALALDAFEAVRSGMPDAALAVVGDGPLRASLQARHPQVHFAGLQTGDALASYYASADFFLFPSMVDAYGLEVTEALASGLPVLAFDTGAAAELLPGRGGGRLIPLGEDAHFITAACALAWQHRHAALMRVQARQIALDLPWAPVIEAFESSLTEVAFVGMSSAGRQARMA